MKKRETLYKEYFNWLYDLVKPDRRNVSYTNLCYILYEKPFRWSVPNDDNRCEDGLELRDLYIQEFELDTDHLEVVSFLERGCSVFEVFVALARRINDIQFSLEDHADHTPKWFYEILLNLRLDMYTDYADRMDPMDDIKIDEILEILLDRTYDFFGNGSLFPMKKRPLQDHRDVEIWYQMMAYLAENYT